MMRNVAGNFFSFPFILNLFFSLAIFLFTDGVVGSPRGNDLRYDESWIEL